jgi:hypothetical protein
MSERIIFKTLEDGVGVITKFDGTPLTLVEEAIRVVPLGLPFWIVDETALPTDQTFRDSWEIDETMLGIPDGQGGAI